jgi:hypothetical protein
VVAKETIHEEVYELMYDLIFYNTL